MTTPADVLTEFDVDADRVLDALAAAGYRVVERVTGPELREATEHAAAVRGQVAGEGVIGSRELVAADLLLLSDRVQRFATELAEHRAATPRDEETDSD